MATCVDSGVAVGHTAGRAPAGGSCALWVNTVVMGWPRLDSDRRGCFVSHGDTVASGPLFKKMPCGPNVVLGMGDVRFSGALSC